MMPKSWMEHIIRAALSSLRSNRVAQAERLMSRLFFRSWRVEGEDGEATSIEEGRRKLQWANG
jgi:hypothetical protein